MQKSSEADYYIFYLISQNVFPGCSVTDFCVLIKLSDKPHKKENQAYS